MSTKANILRIIYILLIISAFLTLFPWGVAVVFGGIGVIPVSITITLIVFQIKSFRQIRTYGSVQHRAMVWQIVLGSLIALCVAFVIGVFSSIDCVDVCSGVPSSRGYIAGTITFAMCLLPIFTVYKINQSLRSELPPETVSSSPAPTAPDSPAPQVSTAPTEQSDVNNAKS